MKFIDCFTFYNELDMLEFRLSQLYDIVDYFILVEATKTQAGHDKILYFDLYKQRYEKYLDKIIHIIVTDMPTKEIDPWIRENHQRRCIKKGLEKINLENEDIITISDLDEIVDPNTLKDIKNKGLNGIFCLEQDIYFYNFNCKGKIKWYHAKILNYGTYLTINDPQQVRMTPYLPVIKKGGWHLSYFGNIDFIKNKIKNQAHQEFNSDFYLKDDQIMNQIKNCDDLYLRDNNTTHGFHYVDFINNDYLPDNYTYLIELLQK